MKAVIYTRVSTEDQSCERQVADLRAYAAKAGYEVVGEYTEKASGMKNDRIERAKVMKLAQARKIDIILVTEMTRWGRSTIDLLSSLQELQAKGVSIVAQTGFQFDLTSPQGKLIAGVLSSISEFERDLIAERTKSGLAAAVARGQKLGRPEGSQVIGKHKKAVQGFKAEGKSIRWIAKELQISKDSVSMLIKA